MTKANAIRQGDVMLWPAKIPANAKQINIRPIALGELTGHHHSLVAEPGVALDDAVKMFEVRTDSGVETYIRVTGDGISLVHQQHKPHAIEKGSELVYIPQVENSDWGTTRVQD